MTPTQTSSCAHVSAFAGRADGLGADQRSGVAMMLVLVALGVAGATTTLYLVAQENAPDAGVNVELAASADWAAKSGSEIALAILQTEEDWLAPSADGRLIDTITLGGVNVTVMVTNLSGQPPTEEDRDLVVSAIANAGGVTSTTQTIVSVQPDVSIEDAVDPELGEFGVFAGASLNIEDGSMLMPWNQSPNAAMNKPISLGLGFTSSGDYSVDASARMVGVRAHTLYDASSALQTVVNSSGQYISEQVIPVKVPTAPAVPPATFAGLPVLSMSVVHSDSATPLDLAPGAYGMIDVQQGAVMTLGATGPGDYRFDNMVMIHQGGVLRIVDDVRILAEKKFCVIQGGAIEIVGNGRLTLYTMEDVTISDSVVGLDAGVAADSMRDMNSITKYLDPRRVRILAVGSSAGGLATPDYVFEKRAIVIGSIHAPTATVLVDYSILAGRITAGELNMVNNSAILYDSKLNNGVGFTNKEGPLYKADCSPIDGLYDALENFNPNSGMGSLWSWLNTNLPSVIPTLGLPGPGPTPRSSARAFGETWPIAAYSLERVNPDPAGNGMGGSFVMPDWEDPNFSWTDDDESIFDDEFVNVPSGPTTPGAASVGGEAGESLGAQGGGAAAAKL